ncbi:16S rRNA (uracil(1498)-N(3))-methyltransferase [Harryflintia acetispora]|uniref:Ribosomal RNA small subunit methyltransferase E n=1 Tax=Harryflintia acetispora TaxID=1849041 RepID=A0A9X8UKT3_9FIRM|nr:16S rRNA (uracil(1498)-N(3))-methyltransferase [Harryflintia acetispora]TCL44612.1 16S rRNA (uracil1498-N3)-methyltransferase [Harryflintia acetispora]
MPRFFTHTITGDLAQIEGPDASHIALSLRMRHGEELTVCDGEGTDYPGTLEQITPELVTVRLSGSLPSPGEPKIKITLFQALCKGEKMDTIVQKAVELGTTEIVPLLTRRCVARPDQKGFEKKRQRYAKIALEAAKQCGRGIVPQVGELITLDNLLVRMEGFSQTFLFYEQAQRLLGSMKLDGIKKLAVIVGSEGGFDPGEAELLKQAGAQVLSLGSRILRCETAPLAALAAILCLSGEL